MPPLLEGFSPHWWHRLAAIAWIYIIDIHTFTRTCSWETVEMLFWVWFAPIWASSLYQLCPLCWKVSPHIDGTDWRLFAWIYIIDTHTFTLTCSDEIVEMLFTCSAPICSVRPLIGPFMYAMSSKYWDESAALSLPVDHLHPKGFWTIISSALDTDRIHPGYILI